MSNARAASLPLSYPRHELQGDAADAEHVCSSCQQRLPKTAFTGSQLNNGVAKRRCKQCVVVAERKSRVEQKASRKAKRAKAREDQRIASEAQLKELEHCDVSSAADLMRRLMPPPQPQEILPPPPSEHEPSFRSLMPPPPLPSERAPSLRSMRPVVRKDLREQGWTSQWSSSRERWYFYNDRTGEKQWRPPDPPIGETAVGRYLASQVSSELDTIRSSCSAQASAVSDKTPNQVYLGAVPPAVPTDDARSVATSAISIRSTMHSRHRVQQRGIEKKELQRAIKRASHTAVPGSGHETHVIRYGGVAVVTDAATHKTVVSAWRNGVP